LLWGQLFKDNHEFLQANP